MWQQPKTDWQASYYFNIGDYNRIRSKARTFLLASEL